MTETQDMMRLIVGYRVSQAVHVAVGLRLADFLDDEPTTIGELEERTGADADGLRRLLRALSTIGVCHECPEDAFTGTALGATLRTDHPAGLWRVAASTGSEHFWTAWGRLEHSVRTGQNAFSSVYGMSAWDYRQEHPETAALFDLNMVAQTKLVSTALMEAYDFSSASTIVDVGGGYGSFLAAALTAGPQAGGVLFDLPHVVAGAPAYLDAQGVSDRVRVEAGSFFESVPDDGDVYLLKSILHDWEDDDCVRILRTCRASMPDTAVLLVVERLIGAPNEGEETKFSDLNMLVMSGGRERSLGEYEALLAAAGFALARTVPTSSKFWVMETSGR